MADTNPIKIFKGDDTDFNGGKFLTIKINTEMDLTGFKGIFKLGKFKTEQDMQSKTMEIVIPHEVTALMLNGTHTGIFTLIDTKNRVKTLSNTIPFLVTSEVFTQEEDSIDLPVPEGYPYEIIVELGGASDYNSLQNIPTFEGQPIKGNLTFQSTGIAPLESLDALVQVVNQKANTVDVQNACGQLQEQITTNKNDIAGLGDQTQEIEAKIPQAASENNQLADKQFVQDLTSALNFVQWVDALPETGESKYIYAVPREETDTDGKQIAALYLWDGSAWRGAGAFSLNIDPDTLATKEELVEVEAKIPINAYTKANLIASNEIEIVPEPVEGGIDSHTKGCWHFDGNNENAVDGSVMTSSSTSFDTNGRFGSCAKTPTFTGWMPTPSDDYTWDLWFKTSTITGYGNGQVGGIGNYSGGYKYGCFYKQNEKLYAVRNGESMAEQPFATLQENVWTHLALTRQNNIERWFVNGKLIRQGENTYNATVKQVFKSATNADFCRTDEYRISDIARWTEDFEPPTKPYSLAVPTGNYVVRNKTELVHKSDIGIANGVASLDANAKLPAEQIPVATASSLGGVKLEFNETTGTLNIKTE